MSAVRAGPGGILLLSCLLLAACATAPPGGPLAEGPWPERRAALSGLRDWHVSGRIGVTSATEGWHANVHWQQQGQHYLIDLIGPLGQGRLRVEGDESGVVVHTADGQVLRAAEPEQILEQAVGMRIPLQGLIYWIRGLPDPAKRSELTGDAQGRLVHLEQDGWSIDYPRYERVAALELPTRISARQGDLQVKLAIGEWKI